MSMNRICLMGRIGRDLELKKTNSGVSVVFFDDHQTARVFGVQSAMAYLEAEE